VSNSFDPFLAGCSLQDLSSGKTSLVRNANLRDLDAIQKIEDASFGDYDQPFPREIFLKFLQENPAGFRVIEDRGVVAGYCYTSLLGRSVFGRQVSATIYSLAISPDARRRGFATLLLKDSIDSLKGKNVDLMLQVAIPNVAAQNLYTRFGFVMVRMRHHYYGVGKHAYEMKLHIE
jgi:ribosomal-protein-alanine N-acetyltransferase